MARYMVAEEFHGLKRYVVHIFVRFSANTTVQSGIWYIFLYGFLQIVRFLNGTVYGSSRPRYTHGKHYRGKFTV